MPDIDEEVDSELSGSTPRWVKVFGIIAIITIALVVVLHLTGNALGGHIH